MTRHLLTRKQRPVYEFIKSYLGLHRHSPLIREIQTACNIRSYKSVVDRLTALERRGLIRRLPNKHRGIELAEWLSDADIAPQPLQAPIQSLPVESAAS